MKIVIIGTGYVGLVTGTCFAERGNKVTCVDIDDTKINNLLKGILPIYEPGLEELVKSNIDQERLFFTTSITDAIDSADLIFIAVGTPPGEDGSADLQYVLGVASDIGKNLTDYAVIVDKSTVPVGTGDEVEEIDHRLAGVDQPLVHVDVDDLGAVLDLIAGHVQRGRVVAIGDQLAEPGGAGDVGALAHIDEGDVLREHEGLEAREAEKRIRHRPEPPPCAARGRRRPARFRRYGRGWCRSSRRRC